MMTETTLLPAPPILADAEYIGVTVLNAPGGWTRVGPTWRTRHGYLVYGPGAARWGTTLGLAELASAPTAKPTWHATGWALCPAPNILYLVAEVALGSKAMGPVREALAAVSHLTAPSSSTPN